MLSIVLTTLAAFQIATPAPTLGSIPPVLTTAASATVAIASSMDVPSDEYLARAQRAFSEGRLEDARRDFKIAATLDRDAGRLPIAASFGLSRVLLAQNRDWDAANTLNGLAREAADLGDHDTEARALLDALWFNQESRQLPEAKDDAERLIELLNGTSLTAETRLLIANRTT